MKTATPPCAHGEPDAVTSRKSGSAGGGEETTGRKADTAPRRRPNQSPAHGPIAKQASPSQAATLHPCRPSLFELSDQWRLHPTLRRVYVKKGRP
jgi:hypothetical protein